MFILPAYRQAGLATPAALYTYADTASFMTHTANSIKKKFLEEDSCLSEKHKINKYDRTYQVWKREPLSIELFTEKTFLQKLEYIHNNPVAAGLVKLSEDYHYSSAKFYEFGIDDFNMLTHYSGN